MDKSKVAKKVELKKYLLTFFQTIEKSKYDCLRWLSLKGLQFF
jgi:hypothetical protein